MMTPNMMTKEKLLSIIERDMPGWSIHEDEMIFCEKGEFSIIIRKGNREKAIVIDGEKVVE